MLLHVNAHRPPTAPSTPNVPTIRTVQEQPLNLFHIDGVGDLRALAVKGENIAWVGGTKGKIAKTENGGKTWTICPIPDGNKLDFRALCLPETNVVCAMSVGPAEEGLSRVYRTVDGGKNWDLVLSPKEKGIFFNAMAFWDEKHGIILSDPVDGRFALFTTNNGGETWDRLIPVEMPFAMNEEGAFAASNSCLAVQGTENVWFATGGGPSARVFYSSDRGLHWNIAKTPMEVNSSSSGIFSLAFLDENIGIAVGGDHKALVSYGNPNIIITRDGGRNWEPVNNSSLSGHYLSCVAWDVEKRPMVVDGSLHRFNSVAMEGNCGWTVGPDGKCAKFYANTAYF